MLQSSIYNYFLDALSPMKGYLREVHYPESLFGMAVKCLVFSRAFLFIFAVFSIALGHNAQ